MQSLKIFPYHVLGIILFFITHGYSDYTGLIPIKDLLIFFVSLLVVSAFIFYFFFRKLKSSIKAGILTTLVLAFYLFFGAITDAFNSLASMAWLSRYRYILPVFIVTLVLLYFYLKRTVAGFEKFNLYLNTVFILLISYDIFGISVHFFGEGHGSPKTTAHFVNIRSAQFDKKPDIYYIVMDEYSGSNTLKNYFKYDNSRFENFLRNHDFFVATSPTCNYKATVFSIASTLSMDYLKWLPNSKKADAADMAKAAQVISSGKVIELLLANGYELHNYSIFDIGDQPSRFNTGLFSFRLKLITAKTLYNKMVKDLVWESTLCKYEWFAERERNYYKEGNINMMALTKEVAEKNTSHPKFIYTHLEMPHFPFIYDSTGKEVRLNPCNNSVTKPILENAYLQYLVYTNKVITGFIEHLLLKTNRQAVIVLMSDHGFREIVKKDRGISAENNFNAVYIPGKDYTRFYDTISNVNQFRVLFNTLFKMNLPVLPDK
jgi:hypothetical protein